MNATNDRDPAGAYRPPGGLAVPFEAPWHKRLLAWLRRLERALVGWFQKSEPRLGTVLLPFIALSVLLYVRHPATNYIFDEQEALLANPYVNATQDLAFKDAIYRDFWGLKPDGSIGSYRPVPNFLWRTIWWTSDRTTMPWLTKERWSRHPWVLDLPNLVLHGVNGALLAAFAYALTRRKLVGWLTGGIFVAAAVITEAVSGIVGIADVLGGLGAILALCALRLPAAAMPAGVFAAVSLGLFSKESAMVCVPLVPLAALLTAPFLHPRRPARVVRMLLALVAALAAFILYVELRKEWFPSPLGSELETPLPDGASWLSQLHREFLLWFRQAPLPVDEMNNPLVDADTWHRIAGALRVYWRGLGQVLFPITLSGDYSFPQEPIPDSLWGRETIAGGAMMVLPLFGAVVVYLRALWHEHRDNAKLVPKGALAAAFAGLFQPGAPLAPGALTKARMLREQPLVLAERRPFVRGRIAAAVILLAAGVSGFVTEQVLIDKGDLGGVRTWPFSLAVVLVAIGLFVDGWRGPTRPMDTPSSWPLRHAVPPLVAIGLTWLVVSYFPHSNIPVLLPTVRAERFWYFPVVGTSLVLAGLFAVIVEKLDGIRLAGAPVAACVVAAFLGMQGMQAYRHSMDYRDDLSFWEATKTAVPRSAKAHLNYSVMAGARNMLDVRLKESLIAQELAPEWAMAHVYTGDVLCRLKRAHEAWPHYKDGFALGPNERSLISLALQCLYDEDALLYYKDELEELASANPGSWLAYLANDTLANHEDNHGVDPKYRPRGYNEGPKD
jgi:protein O-mannosyl-transferase